MSIWRSPVSEGDLLLTIQGAGVVTDLAIGTSAVLSVDHTAEGVFGQCPMPEFTVPAGVLVRVLAEETDGGQFSVEIVNESYASDQGYGGADPDIEYSWIRRGVM